ncbi:hypothetical protein NQ315_015977 [Exocentrus adspersus]|uniref:Uncharacterized protein n=1 Tax=Exocentrus adspersus TaxID=1586481 RepID=A0AAV8VJ14_9CUCU|nr:hypothetical protein NQ315_015977 [Exocentrus adspersus]
MLNYIDSNYLYIFINIIMKFISDLLLKGNYLFVNIFKSKAKNKGVVIVKMAYFSFIIWYVQFDLGLDITIHFRSLKSHENQNCFTECEANLLTNIEMFAQPLY